MVVQTTKSRFVEVLTISKKEKRTTKKSRMQERKKKEASNGNITGNGRIQV